MLALIEELAAFEFEPGAVRATEDDLRLALFAAPPAVFAHVAVEGDGEVVGAAVWYPTFSTWTGRAGIHLTDLIVGARARTRGHGQALFGELVRICHERGCARLDWEVCDGLVEAVDRQEPHGFYARQGASARPGWTAWRMDADALLRAAADD